MHNYAGAFVECHEIRHEYAGREHCQMLSAVAA